MEVPTVLPPKPDLVVRSPSVNDDTLSPGESFTLSVTVGNDGNGNAAWRPTLLYYRSNDVTISPADTEEGAERTPEQKEIGALFAEADAQPFDQPDGAVGGGHVLLRRVHDREFGAGNGHHEQLLECRVGHGVGAPAAGRSGREGLRSLRCYQPL